MCAGSFPSLGGEAAPLGENPDDKKGEDHVFQRKDPGGEEKMEE